ncbi:Myb-like domain [Phytophthora cactorum]|nr:Myb-like domain [Phytophthora cactorum]
MSDKPMKTRQPLMTITQHPNVNGDQELAFGKEEAHEKRSRVNHHLLTTTQRLISIAMENRSSFMEVAKEISDIPARIPAVKPPAKKRIVNGNASDMTTYDSPQRHHVTHDYYKRQEQRKIWQENQALNKRLQSAKATLNFKEWEKDGKWTQEFLKNQEKRRYALQQELRRAQHSPQAVLRSKPLKSLCPHHVKTVALDSDKSVEFPCSLSARDSVRHGSKGQVQLGNRGSSESAVQHPSAANHRRLMKLRKQKPSLLISANAVESSFTEVPVAAVASADQAAFIPDNEIVTVRFTFSRGRSRSTDTTTNVFERSDQPEPLVVKEGDRDMMSLSGAFSPGVELESELNAVAVNDTDPPDKPQRDLTLDADAGTVDNIAVEESDYYQSDADVNNNNSQNDAAASSGKAVETDSSHTSTSECGDSPLNKKQPIQQVPADTEAVLVDSARDDSENVESEIEAMGHIEPPIESKPSPSPDVEHTQSDNEEEEGGYDGDNFADDPLPSTRATGWQHDKLEASGYASEFEDEVHGNVPDAAPTENKCNTVDAVSTDNQEQDSDDEEYSRDDFERSSISSITSSGRRRKNQSLLDVAASLGQRTPDCSQTSGDGVSTRSRQLDFGSVDHGNVDDEQGDQDEAGSPQGSEEVQEVQEVQEEQAEEENQVQEAVATARPRSADEEEFLRRGVEKYGIGKWKKILIDGKDVFSSHRTNVDLKDKWKNLSRKTSRKRRRAPGTAEVEREVQPREVREAASSERTAPRPRRSAAPKTKTSATKKTANVEIGGEEESVDPDGFTVNDSELSGPVTLKFASDKSELVEVIVNLDTCKDVASLKEQLRSSLFSDASPDADIQVIGLDSRVLFEDEEHLSRCITTNGVDFFLVFEENPEEFV